MTIAPDQDGWYIFAKDIPLDAVEELVRLEQPLKLKLIDIPLVTVELAKRLAPVQVDE